MVEFDDSALDLLTKLFDEDEIKSVLSEMTVDLTRYQKDPIGFFRKELGIKIIPDDLVKIAESVRDNKITICQSSTGVGKTFIAGAVATWWYKCFPQSQVIATAAPPEENLKSKLMSEIYDFILANKKLFSKDKILSLKITDDVNFRDEDSEGSNKHFILGKTIPSSGSSEERESKFSGSHAPYLLFLNDEGDAIPDEVYRGEDGCMSSDGARMLVMFNPKRKSGEAYRMIRDGLANVIVLNALNHPNVVSGKNLIPGAVSRDKTIERIYEWTEELREGEEPDSNCFEIPEFLVGAIAVSGSGKDYLPLKGGWRRIKNPAFSYKVLGVYPASNENSLISETDIDKAVSRWKLFVSEYGKKATEGINCILGMDVADQGADDCCVAKRYGNFIAGFETWRGIDVDISSDKLASVYASLDAYQANVEADGIGAAIPPKIGRMFYWKCENIECSGINKTYINENIYQCPICHKEMTRKRFNVRKVYVSSPSDTKCDLGKLHLVRDELAWKVAEWLRKEPSAMIPDDPQLREQMLAYDYYEDQSSGKIKVSDKKTVKKRISTNSDDKFASLRQCFYEPAIPHIRVI